MNIYHFIMNAICMICFYKDLYVIGACIAAHTHKKFIEKNKLKIKLIIMCDKKIYDNFKNLLSKYFDEVKLIKLEQNFEISSKYNLAKKYSSWMSVSTNKWQCLKYEKYNKLLFLDIDILPIKKEFYNVFDNNTPSIFEVIRTSYKNQEEKINKLYIKCKVNEKILNKIKKYKNYYDYIYKCENELGYFYSLDAGIILLKPSKKLYNEYKKFTNKIYKRGVISHKHSSSDETSLYYFFNNVIRVNIYNICIFNAIIPWDYPNNMVNKAEGYNFLSYVKPWIKPKFLQWEEELLWRYILEKMDYNDELNKLLKRKVLENLIEFLNLNYKQKKQRFYIKNYKNITNEINKIKKTQNKEIIYNIIDNLEKKIKYKNFGNLNIKNLNEIL